MIHIQEQAYTETCVGYPWIWIDWLTWFLFRDKLTQKPCVDYAERKIDCTSDTICGRTGVETELNMRAGSLTIRVSVLPLHYTTTTTIGGYGAEMIPIQKQAYTETCLYIEREKLTQAWYWTSLLCYSLLESMRKLLLPSCSTLLSVRPSIRSIGSSCSSTHISQGNLGSNWLLYQINSYNYYIFKSAMLFLGSDCLLSGP